MNTLRSRMRHDDSGVALVAAIALALIGISVASLVVTQTIIVANDTGRDRTRTTEVHTAEAAIDATIAELETSSPCGAPSFSPATYGGGNQQTVVTVTIAYYDSAVAGEITCGGGTFSGTPDRAVITATSTGVAAAVGIPPVRTMEAQVTLEPRNVLSQNAAIFSKGTMSVNTNLTLSPQQLDQKADVWIDDGDWTCSSAASITGGLYVVNGNAKFSSAPCYVEGNTWIQNNFTISNGKATPYVGGDLTVRSGKFTAKGDVSVVGDVTVGGAKDFSNGKVLTAGGPIAFNVGAANIPNKVPAGIPQIRYDAAAKAEWVKEGFNVSPTKTLQQMAIEQWAVPSYWQGAINSCQFAGYIAGGKPLNFTNQKTVYDLRSCSSVTPNNSITFNFYADTALIMQSYNATGNIHFASGDGLPHKIWIIVPVASDGYSAGNINTGPSFSVDAPINSFWYTPANLTFSSTTQVRGQLYAGVVNFPSPVNLEYDEVGVPGVSLVSAAASSSGFRVGLLYKREA